MPKIIAPPTINSLDGLLTLVVDPEKGVAYLKALQAMRDAIIVNLETLRTKELADEYLASASTKMQEALDAASVAQDMEQDTRAKCAAMLDEARQKVAGHEHTMGLALEQLSKDQAALAKRESEAGKELAEATQQSLFNRNFQATLDKRKQELDEREAKLSKLKAVIGEAGI